jgi:hypothetical protein
MEPSVIAALVAVAVVAGLIAARLQRAAKRGRVEGAELPPEDPADRLSASDQRFRLLSFQGGPVPADLAQMVEELRRNGIEVDEETLRQKLADGLAPDAGVKDLRSDPVAARTTAGIAIVLSADDVPGIDRLPPGAVRVQVTLELQVAGREPVREQRIAVVDGDERALLVEGAAIPVRYDPDDPRSIVLEWEID